MSEEQGITEKINELLQKREAIFQFAQSWSDSVGQELLAALKSVDNRQTLNELANAIYWNEADLPKFPNISLKGIIKDIYCGITGEKLKPSKILEVACPACGELVRATSIQKVKELEQVDATPWRSTEISISEMCCNDCYQLTLEYVHKKNNVLLYPNPLIHDNVKMDYQKFLQSEYWKSIREHIKSRDGGECVICGSRQNLHVHHKNYRHRGYEFRNDLHTLCGNCHAKFHGKDGES